MKIELCQQWPEIFSTANTQGSVLNNRDELNRFFASTERRALRIVEFAVGNRDDAMELVQESMLKLVQKYSNKPTNEWAPLFHRILQSRIRDFYRRQAVRRRIFFWSDWGLGENESEDPIALAPDSSGVGPEEQFDLDDLAPALNKALLRLPYRQQQVFLLRVWECLDVKQTAKAMSCSEGSVKTHYSRAIKKLREYLTEFDPYL